MENKKNQIETHGNAGNSRIIEWNNAHGSTLI